MPEVEVYDFDTIEDFHSGETTLWLATGSGVGRIHIGPDGSPEGKIRWFDMARKSSSKRSEKVFTLVRHRDGILWAGSESGRCELGPGLLFLKRILGSDGDNI